MTPGDWTLVFRSIDWTFVGTMFGSLAAILGAIIGGIRWAVSYYLDKSSELEKLKEERLNNVIRALQIDLRKQEMTTEKLTMALIEMSSDWKEMVTTLGNFGQTIKNLNQRIDSIELRDDMGF